MSATIKVLLAIDGLKSSEGTLQALASQFSPLDTEVRIVNVVQPLTIAVSPQMAADYAPELEARLNEARALVERSANMLASSGFKSVTEVREGDIRERIIESAKSWKADLIIVGSHGQKGLPRLILGSVAEAVARHAPCSVQIVRTTDMISKIVLPVDGSAFSDAAVQSVLQRVRFKNAEVCVLSVVDLAIPIPTSYAGAFRKESLVEAEALVDRVEQKLIQAGFKTSKVVQEGDPRSTIAEYAAKWGANLIVAGSHGRKGLARFLMGSVAEFLIRHASCSVEIVRMK
jgi:universal stress protein A